MTQIIQSVSPPLTIPRQMVVVAVGGGVVGAGNEQLDRAILVCEKCKLGYGIATWPIALIVSINDQSAVVCAGYTEMCPHCYHDHLPGCVMELVTY